MTGAGLMIGLIICVAVFGMLLVTDTRAMILIALALVALSFITSKK